MSTRPARNRPSNSPDERREVVGQLPLSGIRDREKKTSSTGAVIDASIIAWKFCSVTSTAYADRRRVGAGRARRRPPAGGAGGAGRFSPDRSMAPGRLNGCCVMASILGRG